MSRTIGDFVKGATEALSQAGIDGAARDARLLTAAALRIPADRLTLELREPLDAGDEQRAAEYLDRRIAREPLSHILGQRAFFNHAFTVTADVLDPRPETEALVLAALNTRFSDVLDLGTGSGAIIISLLAARPAARGLATDLSEAALAVAGDNATRIGVADRLRLAQSDWFSSVVGRFDLIVSNPPYIALDEMPDLAPELAYEPRMALTDEGDGLSAYRRIAVGAADHLADNGRVMVEIGWQQGPDVAAIFKAAGLVEVAILPDLDGRDRVVTARKP
ncbi:peptide chain release factor N(5)-glutamine methyltransferase [Shimia biformata]|uniref:peptide chain release factor N(5)-glutamine methyltransferase n=1 Tax=Shimia biformata TaxID=1294299 RepID=UPI00194F4EE4